MNVHPLFVHFPLALLVSYSLIELLPVGFFFKQFPWKGIKKFLLYFGTLAAFPTILSGLIAVKAYGETDMTELHEHIAIATIGIFALACLVSFFWRDPDDRAAKGTVMKVLAGVGLVGLVVVGALGAALVYGTHNDPFVTFITSVFGFK